MEDAAGWVAPIATTIAAMMTASNLGSRVTGWGFVVFVVASLAWVIVAISTGQTNLLVANAFLTLINVIGVWRWLGRQAKFDRGAKVAQDESRGTPAPSLFSVGSIADGKVLSADGEVIALGVDAMAECDSGRIVYMTVREGGAGGVGERLHALDWAEVRQCGEGFGTELDADRLAALPELEPSAWPGRPPGR